MQIDNALDNEVANHQPGLNANTNDNHASQKVVCRPPTVAPTNKTYQRTVCTPIAEDSDSTNNSVASSSGIGGSRDNSAVGVEEENSLTSFEGILLNGAPSNLDIDAQEDGSSKDSSSTGSKEKPLQTLMLADLLERKVDKEPIYNGVLGKNGSAEIKASDLVENHIKKVLKESPTEGSKPKSEIEENDVMHCEASDDALIEAPRGIKRSSSVADDTDSKKVKYSNGTTSPDPTVDAANAAESAFSSVKSEEQEDEKDSEKVTVSSTAANLYAALAADCIEDETDLEDPIPVKEETTVAVKDETQQVLVNQVVDAQQQQHHLPLSQPQQQQIVSQIQHIQAQAQLQAQQQLIVAPRQIVVQQAIPNNQVIIPATVKGKPMPMPMPSQPQVLLQQSATGQLQYVVSGGVPGQNYVLAQPQTALVQGQAQTVLVAQTTQQQGTGTKTIIILQPQAAAQPGAQKMVAVTPQGQQVVVTQVPRPLLQSPALGNIPPPLVPTSSAIAQASIIVNSPATQATNAGTVTVAIPALTQQATAVSTSVSSRVVTPTPASTPPPMRPTTPAATTAAKQQPAKVIKIVSSSTESDAKPSTSQQASEQPKTITIKIDPNAFLCEWRGCLK